MNILYNFVEDSFLEIKGGDPRVKYLITFKVNDVITYQTAITSGCWARTNKNFHYYTRNEILVKDGLGYTRVFTNDLKNKDVHIKLKSLSLGDTIAWMPYVEEFRLKHNCHILCSCADQWRVLLERAYPDIKFLPHPATTKCFAKYTIDLWNLPKDWRSLSVQRIPACALGLDYHEIRAKVDESVSVPFHPEYKYVCISEFSSSITNSWHYPNGWQIIVDYLRGTGYQVIDISREESKLNNVIKANGNSIEVTMGVLQNCEFFIGLASGLAWLSWALSKKVIMISGFTTPIMEFVEDNYRIEGVGDCVGCWNDIRIPDGDKMICTKGYQCSRLITPDMVIENIQKVLESVSDYTII